MGVEGSINLCNQRFFHFLKQLQLLRSVRPLCGTGSFEKLHAPELGVRYFKDDHIAFFGQQSLHPFFMHFRIFPAAAMPGVYAVLNHGKPILHQAFPEIRISFPVFFRGRGQIKIYEDPQNPVLV